MTKSSAYFNISWLKTNLNTSTGDLQTKQHKEYLLFLIEIERNKLIFYKWLYGHIMIVKKVRL